MIGGAKDGAGAFLIGHAVLLAYNQDGTNNQQRQEGQLPE
jgi:hypothetical protein